MGLIFIPICRGTTIGIWGILGLGVLIVLSFKSIPETLRSTFTDFRFNNVPFWAIFLPICLFTVAAIAVCIGMKTGQNTFEMIEQIEGFGIALLMMRLLGIVVFVGLIWLMCIIGMFIDGFWSSLLGMVVVPLMHSAPYLTLAIPLTLIFSIILTIFFKLKKA